MIEIHIEDKHPDRAKGPTLHAGDFSWYVHEDKKVLGFRHGVHTAEHARTEAIKFLVNWYSVEQPDKLGI